MPLSRGEDTGFLGLRSALGAAFGTTGAVVHIVAVEPFVDGFTADAEAAGKLADVGAGLAGEGSPRHGFFVGWDGVSVTHVSGPYIPRSEGVVGAAFWFLGSWQATKRDKH